jgi:glutaredoxin 2
VIETFNDSTYNDKKKSSISTFEENLKDAKLYDALNQILQKIESVQDRNGRLLVINEKSLYFNF